MQRKHRLATLAAVAALGALGVAGPAAAQPIDDVQIDTASVDFGENFAGGAPQDPGKLDWNELPNSTSPFLEGNLYLTDLPGVHARVKIEYYDPAHVAPIATRTGAPKNGVNGLAVHAIHLGGITSASRHVHVVLETDAGGSYQPVPGATRVYTP